MDVSFLDAGHFAKSPGFIYPTMTVYAILSIVGTVANILVIGVIIISKKLHTTTNVFIAQLAAGDLMILIFCMPFTVTAAYFFNGWPFGKIMCYVVKFAGCAGATLTVSTLLIMSYERYMAIMKPFDAKSLWSRKKITFVIFFLYAFAIIRSAARPLFVQVFFTLSNNKTGETVDMCQEEPGTTFIFYYNLIGVVVFFLGVFFVIGYLYSKIARHLNSEQCQEMTRNSPDVMAKRKRVIRMLFAIIITFCLCWVFINAVCLMFLTPDLNEIARQDWVQIFLFVARMLEYTNCVINPIIYSLLSTNFKAAAKNVFRRCCCWVILDDMDKTKSMSESSSKSNFQNTQLSTVSGD